MERYHTKHTDFNFEFEHFLKAPTLAQEESDITQGPFLSLSIAKSDSLRNE